MRRRHPTAVPFRSPAVQTGRNIVPLRGGGGRVDATGEYPLHRPYLQQAREIVLGDADHLPATQAAVAPRRLVPVVRIGEAVLHPREQPEAVPRIAPTSTAGSRSRRRYR